MAKPGYKIRIPLPEEDALSLLLKVELTPDMPQQGMNPSKAKKGKRSK